MHVKNVAIGLLIGALVLTGGWLRLERTDWSTEACHPSTGTKLSPEEARNDLAARRILGLHPDNPPVSISSSGSGSLTTLGYPLFLGVFYKAFGCTEDPPLVPIQTVQIALDLVTAVIFYFTVQLLLGRQLIALSVSALYLLQPAAAELPSRLLSATLYNFVDALFLLCLVLFFKCGTISRSLALAFGAAFGLGSLLQPDLLPFLLLFAGVAGLQCFFTRRKVLPYLFILLGCLIVLSSWWFHGWLQPDTMAIRQGDEAILNSGRK